MKLPVRDRKQDRSGWVSAAPDSAPSETEESPAEEPKDRTAPAALSIEEVRRQLEEDRRRIEEEVQRRSATPASPSSARPTTPASPSTAAAPAPTSPGSAAPASSSMAAAPAPTPVPVSASPTPAPAPARIAPPASQTPVASPASQSPATPPAAPAQVQAAPAAAPAAPSTPPAASPTAAPSSAATTAPAPARVTPAAGPQVAPPASSPSPSTQVSPAVPGPHSAAPTAAPAPAPAPAKAAPPSDPDPGRVAVESAAQAEAEAEAAARARLADKSPRSEGTRLGDLLIAHQLIQPDQLAAALLRQTTSGQVLGQVLVEQGVLSESDMLTALAQQLGLEKVDLGRVSPDPEAVALVAERVARSFKIVPLRVEGQMVEVVTSDPKSDLTAALTQAIGRPIRLLVAPSAQVQQAIDTSYRTVDAIEALARGYEKIESARPEPQTGSLTDLAPDAPVVQVVNLIITQALRDRASDVHIESQFDGIRVRFRIDGTLHEVIDLPLEMGPALISRLKILGGMNIVERRRPQDGQIAMTVEGRAIDIRVATVATVAGEKCVLRILDKSRPLFKLQDLGMPQETYETYAKLIRAPFGMVISAGPTGSGKTTTLYAALSDINSSDRNITTVEDPVEYLFPSLNQIQVNEQAGLTFADGLKSILRQDPDVILVGEVRDAETARIAVQSALTGHLVLSSFHATDTPAALHRLLDMGIESFLVASAVTAVVAQRLLRRVCSSCRVPYLPTEEEMAFYQEGNGPETHTFYIGTGCNFCSDTGYRDRVGVYELLRVTPELRRLIVGWATQEELRRTAKAQGMRTLADEGLRLVAAGTTTISEVIRGLYAGV